MYTHEDKLNNKKTSNYKCFQYKSLISLFRKHYGLIKNNQYIDKTKQVHCQSYIIVIQQDFVSMVIIVLCLYNYELYI
jgi:hypothetical protein